MGVVSVVKKTVKITKKVTKTVAAAQAECEGCGKPLRGTKKNVCSTACAQFVAESYR